MVWGEIFLYKKFYDFPNFFSGIFLAESDIGLFDYHFLTNHEAEKLSAPKTKNPEDSFFSRVIIITF